MKRIQKRALERDLTLRVIQGHPYSLAAPEDMAKISSDAGYIGSRRFG